MSTPRLPQVVRAVAISIILLPALVTFAAAAHGMHRHGPRVAPHPLARPHHAPRPQQAPRLLDHPGPLRIPESQIEPVAWSEVDRWRKDDHTVAFATLAASCRPIVRNPHPPRETRRMYPALHAVCRRALAVRSLKGDAARVFFEENFRPVRIAKLGDSAGFLTGYYEPIVNGSRFPTGIFHTPIYRRPPDLVPPANAQGRGFPNTGQSMRRTSAGEFVPYYDRGEIEDGALDGRRLEICWIKEPTDALFIQIQGSARIRLEDGTTLRINYDGHNGYSYMPVGRVLIERNIVPREEMSMQRIRDWMRANPEGASEVRRQNRSFVFFRIVGLDEDREAVGAQGVPLTPGRSIAVDQALHVYGTPFFIEANLSIDVGRPATPLRRLMIAQDTGSAIVGPARADVYWGAGDVAGRIAGRVRHAGRFTMLIPRELDPVKAGALMPLPPPKPPLAAIASAGKRFNPVKAGPKLRLRPKPKR